MAKNSGWLDFGASLGGDLLGGIFGAIDGAASRAWQEKMWHMQNDYNSPKAQIARIKEAGLNPAMMYANGSAGGASASVPSAPAPIMKGVKLDFARALQAKRDAQLQDKQLEGVQHDVALKEEAVQQAKIKTDADRIDLDRKIFGRDHGEWDADLNNKKAQHEIALANVKAITDKNAREEAAEKRLAEIHKEWQDNAEARKELLRIENDLKKLVMQNDITMQEARQKMLQRGFDPNVLLDKDLTFADVQTIIECLLQTEKFRNMRHSDVLGKLQGYLLPLTVAPVVGEFASEVIDWIDAAKTPLY